MFETSLNQKTVTLKIKRIEVCDLMLACTTVAESLKESGESAEKWETLHSKLKEILDNFDEKD